MDTRTGDIRALPANGQVAQHEVELTAEQAETLRPLSPRERLAAFFGGSSSPGKDRKASRPAEGTKPRVAPAIAATLRGHKDHRKLAGRKTAKAVRRATRPHVKRHARSRAHRGHGKA